MWSSRYWDETGHPGWATEQGDTSVAAEHERERHTPSWGTTGVEEQSQELWVSREKGFGKGLNTESNNSQTTTTTVLAGVEGEGTAERRHPGLPRFRALEGGKTPTSCLVVLLVEVLSTGRACRAQGGYNG